MGLNFYITGFNTMATMGGIFTPDYDGALASGLVGTLSNTGTASGPIVLGKYRLWKITFAISSATASANCIIVRFTTGNSVLGHTAPAPSQTTSPFLHNYHENFFEFDGSIDSINLAAFSADGAPTTVAYSILPLTRN